MQVMVLGLQEDVVPHLGLVGHAPDLGAELSTVIGEEGSRLSLLLGLLKGQAARIEVG